MSTMKQRPPDPFDVFPAHVKREIVKVKPGLTGVGSVVFRDEEELMARSPKGAKRCYEEDIAPYKGELEIWYVRNQTIRLDLVLSILTLLVIVFPGIERYTQVFKAVPQKPPQILELYGL